jgi:hypothetical protein
VKVTRQVVPLLFWTCQFWLSRYPVASVPMSRQPSSFTSSMRVTGSVTASRPLRGASA